MPDWLRNSVLYEINTWVWLDEWRRAAGQRLSLAELPNRAWDQIARFKPDAVWLMGIWERSPAGLAIALSNDALRMELQRTLPDLRPEDVPAHRIAFGITSWTELWRRGWTCCCAPGAGQTRHSAAVGFRSQPHRPRPPLGSIASGLARAWFARRTSPQSGCIPRCGRPCVCARPGSLFSALVGRAAAQCI